MNVKGMTLQQKSVAVEIDRLAPHGPPTIAELSGYRCHYSYQNWSTGDIRVGRRSTGMSDGAVRSVVKRLVERGIVEEAGEAMRGKTWAITDEATEIVAEWRRQIDEATA